MKSTTKKIVISAMFAALVYVATTIIKIPSPLQGYINLGDCIVLLGSWILSPVYAFAAAGLGSALADLLSEYAIYAPATFAIKGLMAIVSCLLFKVFSKRLKNFVSRLICGIIAEVTMILGYYLFEGFMYGFGAALVNIPANAVQGGVGLLLGMILITIFDRQNIINTLK